MPKLLLYGQKILIFDDWQSNMCRSENLEIFSVRIIWPQANCVAKRQFSPGDQVLTIDKKKIISHHL